MINEYNICLIILHIARKIACYDQVAESILPRAAYQGRGTGGEGIAGKLCLVTCYLLPTTWPRPQLLLHQSQAQFQPNYSRLPEPEQPTIWKDAGSVSGGPTGPSSRLVYDCPAGGEANR